MQYSLMDFLGLLGSVGLFLYGMKVMSEGLQKAAGDRLRGILAAMTRNRWSGLMTGFAITALIQSSSASTVMVVSFVNAGLMTLAQSMAVIFGANVGTTFTAWVIALFGFKVNISVFVLPLIGISAVPLMFSKNGKSKSIGEFLIGFAFLFMGLDMISNYVPDLQSNPEMFAFLRKYASLGYSSILIFLFVGIILTMVIQSSAATFAITLIMCTKGWINFDLACALVLGSNIGTTITPLLASMSGNVAAKRTAMGHLLFNLLGTIWTVIVFVPFCNLNAWITEAIGQGDPNSLYDFVNNLESSDPDLYNHLFDNSLPAGHHVLAQIGSMQMSVSFGLSIFHTVFNLINVAIMIWLTGLYVKIVERLVPAKHKEDEEFRLKYIGGGLLSSSELNLAQAEKETAQFAERVSRMVVMAEELVHTKPNSEEFNTLYSRIEKYENISDNVEIEIANFLNHVVEGRLSNEAKMRSSAMFIIVSEIESISDACFRISKTLIRKRENNIEFTETIFNNIDIMFKHVKQAMDMLVKLLPNIENITPSQLVPNYNKEHEINNLRNAFRSANIDNINQHKYEYQAGIYYMEIIAELEKLGDYIINILDTIKERLPKKSTNQINIR